MAHTAEGLGLAQAHTRNQEQNVARTLQAATLAYRGLLDPEDLDGTFRPYAAAQIGVLNSGRERAAALAVDYYRALREVEAPDAPELPRGTSQPWNNTGWALLNPAQASTSLLVTGPITVKEAMARGLPVDEAHDRGLARTLGAAGRHIQNAGREGVTSAVRSDPSSGGWARISPGTPCSFCAMLIGRGPVYSKETVRFRSHDNCHCRAEPFFGDSGWTEQARDYRDLWNKTGKQAYGPEAARQSFARAYQERYNRGGMATGRPRGVHLTRE